MNMLCKKWRTKILINHYLVLTKVIMPKLANASHDNWPVSYDHCFQRIVLDAICEGPWYASIPSPAHKHLNYEQSKQAIRICYDILASKKTLSRLNKKSLSYRQDYKTRQQSFDF